MDPVVGEVLAQHKRGLVAREHKTRLRAARSIKNYMESEHRDMSPEAYQQLVEKVMLFLRNMLQSPDVNDRVGAIVAMDEMLDTFADHANEAKIMEIAASLVQVFESSVASESLYFASKVLGHVMSIGGTTVLESVEQCHMVPALQWLPNEKFQSRRCAAVLILKELATNAPTMFYRHIETFFDNIWYGISDRSKNNRDAASLALRAAIQLVQQRDSRQRFQWYGRLQKTVESGLIDKSPEAIHGAYLIENELIRNTGNYMEPYYDKVCKTALSEEYIKHKSPLVKKAVLMLLPQLAKFNPLAFIAHDLGDATRVLLRFMEKPNPCRGDAFIAAGRLAESVRTALFDPISNLEAILIYIRDSLSDYRKREYDAYEEALICLRMLATYVPTVFVRVDRLRDTIDAMFCRGLNKQLIETLTKLSIKLSFERGYIQQTLFHTLHSVLVRSGLELEPTPVPAARRPSFGRNPSVDRGGRTGVAPPTLSRIWSGGLSLKSQERAAESVPPTPPLPSSGSVSLALETLGSFDFSDNKQIPIVTFVRDVVVRFLEDEDPAVRKAAAVTCCKLLLPKGDVIPAFGEKAAFVGDIVERLLTVGIADLEPDIRARVLSSLDSRFDYLLSQPDSLRSLFIALNDEVFEIRETTMHVLGRLSQKSPALVMPALRQTLVQLLAELEYGGDSRNKEESCRLLGHLIEGSSHLVKPYAVPILKALVQNLKQSNVGVEAAVLATLGQLSVVAGSEIRPYLDKLLPEIVNVLQEQTAPQKIQVAIRTLAQIVRSTGYVVKAYYDHPDLLDYLVEILQRSGDANWPLRREASRTLGTLGALDPFKFKMIQLKARGMLTASQSATMAFSFARLSVTNQDSELHHLDESLTDLLEELAAIRATQRFKSAAHKRTSLEVVTPSEMLPSLVEYPHLYYETVAISALLRIMNDPRTRPQTKTTATAIMFICKSRKSRIKPFLGSIIQSFLEAIKLVNKELRGYLIQELAEMCNTMGRHIQPHLGHGFIRLINDYWDLHLPELLNLVLSMASAVQDDLRLYLPDIVPLMLRVIRKDRDRTTRLRTESVLLTIEKLVPFLDSFKHFVLPMLLRLIQDNLVDLGVRRAALSTLREMTRKLDISGFASRIIHPLTRFAIGIEENLDLGSVCIDILCQIVIQMGGDYCVFVPMVNQYINKQTYKAVYNYERYEGLVSRVLKNQPLPIDAWSQQRSRRANLQGKLLESSILEDDDDVPDEDIKRQVVFQNLMKAWDPTNRTTKDDWNEWMRTFTMELLRESPSVALHACVSVASAYQGVAMDLFNAAFLRLWPVLQTSNQESLARALESALQSPNLPPEILQTLLNLAEFMEHVEPLPIEPRMLADLAEKVHSYAKALYYLEMAFTVKPDSTGIEPLISINNKLNQPEAAIGILKYSQKHLPNVPVNAIWYEKLQRWNDALDAHRKALAKNPASVDSLIGCMRCYKALGDWSTLEEYASDLYDRVYNTKLDPHLTLEMPSAMREEMCSLGAYAVVALGQYDQLPKYLVDDFEPVRKEMFSAMLAIKSDNLSMAKEHIEQGRQFLDPRIRALVSESYQRAYTPHIVDAQLLAELEDLVEYRASIQHSTTKDSTQSQLEKLRSMWSIRMLGAERSIDVWQVLLVLRSQLLDPVDDLDTWLRYSALCRQSGALNLERNALLKVGANELFQSIKNHPYQPLPVVFHDPKLAQHRPRVAFAFLKHIWAEGQEDVAIYQLSELTAALERLESPALEITKLRMKCHLRLGEWLMIHSEHTTGPDAKTYDDILETLQTATRLDDSSYKAWHEWAMINFKLTQFCAKEEVNQVSRHALAAMKGFFRSIYLGQQRQLPTVMQDVLRLLTIWFSHGHRKEIHDAMLTGNSTINTETWLGVVPQLIARIHTSNPLMNQLLQTILTRIGLEHPQGLIYPIMVAYKSTAQQRKLAAKHVLDEMRRHSSLLVSEAELVSQELIRVAIQWPEMWHEALEDAAKHCFSEKNPMAMVQVLAPLHEIIESIDILDATTRERAFYQAFARDLSEAKEWTDRYQVTLREEDLNQAWDLYYHVFRRIQKQFGQMQSLQLENAAPKLLSATNLSLAIPGSYRPGGTLIHIASFSPSVSIMTSKQRPRKLTIVGSDGNNYMFLLKGHEDLRQDERVMQLFGLINTLLQSNRDTNNQTLSIRRYSVLPLSHTAGMLGWVPNCDTLHQLIRDYRESRKIPQNVEQRLMLRMAPDYDKLTIAQKVELFEDVLAQTTGQDLSRVLWLKSQNSEVWLERRKNYTRSLALMSMVGYILGLGDRHLSNLMLERSTGIIVHIDFGDCFEVAMHREKYPEKIPFRLTRMMTTAMEVSGIEGNYRFTCEATMKVLRENRDSLMATLEAFVHDPLINWRLLKKNMASPSHAYSPEVEAGKGDGLHGDEEDEGKENGAAKMSRRALTTTRSRSSIVEEVGSIDVGGTGSQMLNAVAAAAADDVDNAPVEELNERAVKVIDRVEKKLRGRDFNERIQLSVAEQVDRLIRQATSIENLCQCYIGWGPFW